MRPLPAQARSRRQTPGCFQRHSTPVQSRAPTPTSRPNSPTRETDAGGRRASPGDSALLPQRPHRSCWQYPPEFPTPPADSATAEKTRDAANAMLVPTTRSPHHHRPQCPPTACCRDQQRGLFCAAAERVRAPSRAPSHRRDARCTENQTQVRCAATSALPAEIASPTLHPPTRQLRSPPAWSQGRPELPAILLRVPIPCGWSTKKLEPATATAPKQQ